MIAKSKLTLWQKFKNSAFVTKFVSVTKNIINFFVYIFTFKFLFSKKKKAFNKTAELESSISADQKGQSLEKTEKDIKANTNKILSTVANKTHEARDKYKLNQTQSPGPKTYVAPSENFSSQISNTNNIQATNILPANTPSTPVKPLAPMPTTPSVPDLSQSTPPVDPKLKNAPVKPISSPDITSSKSSMHVNSLQQNQTIQDQIINKKASLNSIDQPSKHAKNGKNTSKESNTITPDVLSRQKLKKTPKKPKKRSQEDKTQSETTSIEKTDIFHKAVKIIENSESKKSSNNDNSSSIGAGAQDSEWLSIDYDNAANSAALPNEKPTEKELGELSDAAVARPQERPAETSSENEHHNIYDSYKEKHLSLTKSESNADSMDEAKSETEKLKSLEKSSKSNTDSIDGAKSETEKLKSSEKSLNSGKNNIYDKSTISLASQDKEDETMTKLKKRRSYIAGNEEDTDYEDDSYNSFSFNGDTEAENAKEEEENNLVNLSTEIIASDSKFITDKCNKILQDNGLSPMALQSMSQEKIKKLALDDALKGELLEYLDYYNLINTAKESLNKKIKARFIFFKKVLQNHLSLQEDHRGQFADYVKSLNEFVEKYIDYDASLFIENSKIEKHTKQKLKQFFIQLHKCVVLIDKINTEYTSQHSFSFKNISKLANATSYAYYNLGILYDKLAFLSLDSSAKDEDDVQKFLYSLKYIGQTIHNINFHVCHLKRNMWENNISQIVSNIESVGEKFLDIFNNNKNNKKFAIFQKMSQQCFFNTSSFLQLFYNNAEFKADICNKTFEVLQRQLTSWEDFLKKETNKTLLEDEEDNVKKVLIEISNIKKFITSLSVSSGNVIEEDIDFEFFVSKNKKSYYKKNDAQKIEFGLALLNLRTFCEKNSLFISDSVKEKLGVILDMCNILFKMQCSSPTIDNETRHNILTALKQSSDYILFCMQNEMNFVVDEFDRSCLKNFIASCNNLYNFINTSKGNAKEKSNMPLSKEQKDFYFLNSNNIIYSSYLASQDKEYFVKDFAYQLQSKLNNLLTNTLQKLDANNSYSIENFIPIINAIIAKNELLTELAENTQDSKLINSVKSYTGSTQQIQEKAAEFLQQSSSITHEEFASLLSQDLQKNYGFSDLNIVDKIVKNVIDADYIIYIICYSIEHNYTFNSQILKNLYECIDSTYENIDELNADIYISHDVVENLIKFCEFIEFFYHNYYECFFSASLSHKVYQEEFKNIDHFASTRRSHNDNYPIFPEAAKEGDKNFYLDLPEQSKDSNHSALYVKPYSPWFKTIQKVNKFRYSSWGSTLENSLQQSKKKFFDVYTKFFIHCKTNTSIDKKAFTELCAACNDLSTECSIAIEKGHAGNFHSSIKKLQHAVQKIPQIVISKVDYEKGNTADEFAKFLKDQKGDDSDIPDYFIRSHNRDFIIENINISPLEALSKKLDTEALLATQPPKMLLSDVDPVKKKLCRAI